MRPDKPCVAMCTLYGGAKNQRRNFVRVPRGSVGTIVWSEVDEYGAPAYRVRFPIGGRMIWCRVRPECVGDPA